MSLPRYSEYKNSGVEWLREIPSHWSVLQSRRMFAVRSEPALASDRMLTASQKYGVLYQEDFVQREGRRVAEVILGVDSLKHVEPDDFIISMRSFQGGLEWSKLRGSTSFHYVMLRPVKHAWPPFFSHLFKSAPYIQALRRTTDLIRDGQELRYGNFVKVDLPVVPLEEQRAIATFLDREISKIDALVSEQERLIILLAEKRQATISHAVTKGLNPNASMKDSGVKWLGEVPQHWGVCVMRRVLKLIEQGWSPECESRIAEDGEWGVLKAGCVNRGVFNENDNKALPATLSAIDSYEVKQGDLLMSRASGSPSLIGSVAYVQDTREKLMLSDKIFRLHFDEEIDSQFIAYLCNSKLLRTQIEQAISGAEGLANNLPQSKIKEFCVVVPPLKEQYAIVSFLAHETVRLDALIDEATRGIELLKERRSALISAAVTGKIDVRQAVQQEQITIQEAA